jgi:hypothetical protein
VLDQLSLLKMSPGGGAASFGIVLSQGPLPNLEASAYLARRRAPFTLCQNSLAPDGTGSGRF